MKTFLQLFAFLIFLNSYAQQPLTYQQPSEEILELADVDLAPGVQIDSKGKNVVLLYRISINLLLSFLKRNFDSLDCA
jgi:hypothetical protein